MHGVVMFTHILNIPTQPLEFESLCVTREGYSEEIVRFLAL